MTPRTIVASLAAALLIAVPAPAQGQFPANGDFAEGRQGWTLPEGCELQAGALSVSGAWAVSDASAAPLEGWQRVEVRVKGPGRGSDSVLNLALAGAGAEPAAQVSTRAADIETGWHTLSAELLPPPDVPASVALGVEGSGAWLVDSVSVAAVELPEPEPSEFAPVVPEPLAADWEPDGLLDAVERPLGAASELLVSVGSLEVGLPTEVTISRAHRGSVRLIVSSRATRERELTVSVAGPPGFFAPDRTVPIRPGGDTAFKASLQAFFTGTRWARMTFRAGEYEASAPIRVTVEPSYPAPGVNLADGDPPAAIFTSLVAAGIPLVAAQPGVNLPDYLARLRLLAPPWSGEALLTAAARAAGDADFVALHHPRGAAPDADGYAATRTLREALERAAEGVSTLGPPADLRAGPPPTISQPDLSGAQALGAAGVIAAPSLRLPVLAARPARAVMIDRQNAPGAQPAWTRLSEALAVDGIAAAIRQRARLPMFISDLAARSTGSPEADAAVLARALVICAYQGATGWTVPARPQDAPEGAAAFCPFDAAGSLAGPVGRAYSELSRELAAAVPLVILKQTPEIGSAPDAQIGFRPFMRNDEGILALWNNTGAPVDLIFEVRTQPFDMHTVSVGPEGVRREYVGSWHFSEDAITLNRPVVFVTLQPAELKVLSMQLAQPHVGWLASVEPKPQIKRTEDGRKSFMEEWEEKNLYR